MSYSMSVCVSAAGYLSFIIRLGWFCFLLNLGFNFTCISNMCLNTDAEFHKRSSLERTAGEMQERQATYQISLIKVFVLFSVSYKE